MPIRMTDDDPRDSGGDDDSPRPGGGGGGGSGGGSGAGGAAILGLLFFAFRHPKITVVLLLVAGVFYMCSGPSTSSSGDPSDETASSSGATPSKVAAEGQLGTGAVLDQKVYDTALVHEPLAESGLPSRVSLREYAPARKSQGRQGSCVGWATSYAARSILHARQTGTKPAAVAFSPSFVYNQIGKSSCQGSYLVRALETMEGTGDLPLSEFAYDQKSCTRKPNSDEKERAADYKIAGYTRLTVDSEDYRNNAMALKQHLAQGAPVVIGMKVGGTFETEMQGKRVWHPTEDDREFRGDWGGHAMAVIGYDDTLEGGAFELMNSWGDDWGEGGVAFVKYKDFDHFVKEAYGLYPMGKAEADEAQHIRFGLVDNATKKHIALKPVEGIVFRTVKPIKAGTRFKVEFSNSKPVYTYLFGQETDGTSYVLFPYTPKHSPYCGTTGVRVFPRKQSLEADDKGTRDSVAVVISPKALDFKRLNEEITGAAGASYGEKLQAALGDSLSSAAKARVAKDMVELDADESEDGKVHALVLEFDKN
ncbi:MAG TPA: C1 family peptidase [Myxococcales bacterium]|jgi:C1A family cysteine protease